MTADRYVPTPADRFSFGIWTVGWQGVDVFGPAVRPPMPAIGRSASSLSWALTGSISTTTTCSTSTRATPGRDKQVSAFRAALADTGLVVTTATTNLFSHPIFKEGAFTANDRDVRRFALAKTIRNIDLAAELGPGCTCAGAAGKARSRGPARTSGPRWSGTRRRSTC